jgi:ATP-dependent exoDNAse (exonuclease V) beta subunit
VHSLLEHVGWIDETRPKLPDNDAGDAVARLIKNPDLKHLFERAGRSIDLYREQATDVIVDGTLRTGVIDRLHLHRGPYGQLLRIEIIDFKTDVIEEPTELPKLYASQMEAYRQAIQQVYPEAGRIDCILVSTKHGTAVCA